MARLARIRLEIVNWEAIQKLSQIAEILADLHEDLPWREDTEEASRLLMEAVESIVVKGVPDD